MTDSQKLLADYVNDGSETAFRELVTRYIDLVFSTALRLVDGDSHRAEDVAQTVFTDLARQSSKLPADTLLGGWLHRDTCFIAAKVMRGERRRQVRERWAAEMNALNTSAPNLGDLAPVLDEAINELGEEDRKSILLRFYEGRDLRSVGEALGSSENAAQKRVTRALEQLRVVLARRGIALSTVALGTALASKVVTAAPVGLASQIAATALAGVASGSSITLSTLKILSMTKFKLVVIGSLLVTGVAIPLEIQHVAQQALRQQNQALQQQLGELAVENERLSNGLAQANISPPLAAGQLAELLRLRGEVAVLRNSRPATSGTGPASSQPASHSQQLNAYLKADAWKDAGTETAEAAVQTLFWSAKSEDTNMMKALIYWDAKPDTQDLAAWEGTVAQLVEHYAKAAKGIQGFRLLSVTEADANSASVNLEVTDETGAQVPMEFAFRKTDKGWRQVIGNDQ